MHGKQMSSIWWVRPKTVPERQEDTRMKKLNQFTYFALEEFSKGKRFMSIGQQEWKDFKTGNILGTKVETVIVQDKTDYGVQDGEVVSNLYEKLTIKVPKKISVPMNVEIKMVNAVATVYGDFRNQLSVVADNIEVISK